jgi:dihydroorotate dehydrogenase electron transfer subunit
MKRIINGIVEFNEEIVPGIRRMVVQAPEAASEARAGQFVNIYPKAESTLLPRPLSVCDADADAGTITIIYRIVGKGTKEFAGYEKGTPLRMSTPLGNGYDLEGVKDSAILVGGGLGVPPLIMLAKSLVAAGVKVTVVLGYRDDIFLADEMEAAGAGLFIATECETDRPGVIKGNALDLIRQNGLTAANYFACGPRPMLKSLTKYLAAQGSEVQVSMEERMGCGYGACVGCVCKVIEDGAEVRRKVCTDGPVFRGSEVVW